MQDPNKPEIPPSNPTEVPGEPEPVGIPGESPGESTPPSPTEVPGEAPPTEIPPGPSETRPD